MAKLEDVIAYIAKHYPHKGELSNARMTKMVYLSDWKHAIGHQSQITNIKWYFDNYGPFVWDVAKAAESAEVLSVSASTNFHGKPKRQISLVNKNYIPKLSKTESTAIDHVILQTSDLYWSDFIKLVYSTYPIVMSDRYCDLDLVKLSSEYKAGLENKKLDSVAVDK